MKKVITMIISITLLFIASCDKTGPDTKNNIILEIYSDGWGTLLQTIYMEEEGDIVISIDQENPYYDPPQYFIYAKRAGFYTNLYYCNKGDTINVHLAPIIPDKFCGVLFMDNGYFADNVIANTDVTIKKDSIYFDTFTTDEHGRFAINIPFDSYTIEFIDYVCEQDTIYYEEDFFVDNSYKDFSIYCHSQMDKPNIYIYPEYEMELDVIINFPNGGSIVQSIPEYGAGWHINVKPLGLINNQYEYLFYESQNPDLCQYSSGWVIKRDDLENFFVQNMTASGFNQKEIADFIEYWIPILIDYPFYAIYPQYSADLEKMVQLNFSERPDSILRLVYEVKGLHKNNINISSPEIPKFERIGFTVVEWGVIRK